MINILNKLSDLLYNYDEALEARNYLNSRVSNDLQKKITFGYFPSGNQIKTLLPDVSLNSLIEDKLIYIKNIDNNLYSDDIIVSFFEYHPLIIPYYNVYGELIALAGRTLLSSQKQKELKIPKYKNTIFKKGQNLFGLNWAKQEILAKDSVFIVEGQIDVLTAIDHGINNVVAVGSATLSGDQLSLLLRYTTNINILFDNDTAGKNGYELIIQKYNKYANFNYVQLPDYYKDLDEYLNDGNILI